MSLIKNTYGQVDVTSRNIEQAKSVNDVWNMNVSVQQNYVLYFQVTINSNKSGKIYEARSNNLQLLQGTYSLNSEVLKPIQELFVFPNWDYKFMDDLYNVQIQSIAYPSGQLLTTYTTSFSFNARTNSDTSRNIKKKINFSVNGGLNGQYSDAFNSDFSFQPNYVRFDIHPTLNLFDIPFSADIFVTTEQKQSANTINNFVFKFDYNKLKDQLIQKLIKESDKVIQDQIPEKYSFLKKMSVSQAPYYYKNAEALTKQIQSPEVWKDIKTLEKLQQYKELINNPEIKDKLSAFDEYKSKLKIENTDELASKLKDLKTGNYDIISKWTKDLHLDTIQKLKKLVNVLNTANSINDPIFLNDIKSGKYEAVLSKSKDFQLDTIQKLKKISKILNEANRIQDTALLEDIRSGKYKAVLSKVKDLQLDTLQKLKEVLPILNTTSTIEDTIRLIDLANIIYDTLNNKILNSRSIDSLKKLNKILDILNNTISIKEISFIEDYKWLYKNYDSTLINNMSSDVRNGIFKNIDSLQTNKSVDAQKYLLELKKYTGVGSIKEAEQLLDLDKEYRIIKTNALSATSNKKELKKLMQQYDKIKDVDKIDINKLLTSESNFNSLLKGLNVLTKKELFFKNVKRFELGTTFPEVSTLGISGTVVKGYNIEYSTSKLYLSSFAGKADNFRLDTLSTSAVKYKKIVASLGVGYGNKQETHFHIHYIYTKEKGKKFYDSLTTTFYSPAQNHVLISDIGGLFFRKNLYIGNEFGYSIYFTSNQSENASRILKNTIKGLSQKTYIIAKIPKTHTKLNASVSYVGANYVSLNTPFIFRDRIILESRIEQPLFKNKLLLSSQYRLDIDSISRNNLYRNYIHSANINLTLNIPKYPYIQISYVPIITKLSIGISENRRINYTGSFILNAGYNYTIRKDKSFGSTQLTYSNNLFNMLQLFGVNAQSIVVNYLSYTNQNIHTLSIRQTFGLKKNTNIQMAVSYMQPSYSDTLIYKTISTELSMSWVLLKKSINMVGVSYSYGNNTNRIGFFVQTTFPITKYINMDIRLQKEQLKRQMLEFSDNIHGITLKTQLRFKI